MTRKYDIMLQEPKSFAVIGVEVKTTRTGFIQADDKQLLFDALAITSRLAMPIGVGPVPNVSEVRYVGKGIGTGTIKLFDARKTMLEIELNLLDISSTYYHTAQGNFRPSDYMPKP